MLQTWMTEQYDQQCCRKYLRWDRQSVGDPAQQTAHRRLYKHAYRVFEVLHVHTRRESSSPNIGRKLRHYSRRRAHLTHNTAAVRDRIITLSRGRRATSAGLAAAVPQWRQRDVTGSPLIGCCRHWPSRPAERPNGMLAKRRLVQFAKLFIIRGFSWGVNA